MSNDSVFKALSDPTRRKILHLINDRELTAGQISEYFDITAPSMSHHFGVLKQADLVYVRRDGQQLYYSLNTTVFQDLVGFLMDLFGKDDKSESTAENAK
jgi:DNA-binding transcriptional ArsR family regulator